MILPNKYTPLEESYIGIAAHVLEVLGRESLYVDVVWQKFQHQYGDDEKLSPSYAKFVYVTAFMFSCGMISYNEGGEIFNENLKLADSR